ncbi:hypothetical protein ACRBEV_18120 [Methylobacterium phyllosphaerae]
MDGRIDEAVAVRRGVPADVAAIRALVAAAYTKWIPVIGRLPIPYDGPGRTRDDDVTVHMVKDLV